MSEVNDAIIEGLAKLLKVSTHIVAQLVLPTT